MTDRHFRVLPGLALLVLLYPDAYSGQLWWMAWFVAFALVGAGLSGVCLILSSLRPLGFRWLSYCA